MKTWPWTRCGQVGLAFQSHIRKRTGGLRHEPCTDRWARPGMVGPACRGQKVFLFWMETINCWGCLSLPPTPLSPPNRPITSINSQATLHLHRQLLRLLVTSCARSTAVDRRHGPQGEAKGKHPFGKLPSSLLIVGKLLAKKTLLLILIGEIDLDFVFLISVHCMLQSSGGSDTPPASFI